MRVIVFGSSGMVGQGALRECLRDPGVEQVITVVRTVSGHNHEKLKEILTPDLSDLTAIEPELADIDACFYCIGISSMGTTEAEYHRVTYDFTASAAASLARVNPAMTFVFVSAKGADSSEQGRVMWARVKGAAENLVLRTFPNGYVFRPGVIQPLHGVKSKTTLYRFFYTVFAPILFLLRPLTGTFTTSEQVGRAMLAIARQGYPKRILENEDINAAH